MVCIGLMPICLPDCLEKSPLGGKWGVSGEANGEITIKERIYSGPKSILPEKRISLEEYKSIKDKFI